MNLKSALIVTVFVLLAGCTRSEQPVDAVSANEAFDAAVNQLTLAYFEAVPEAATQLGIPEDTVPGTSTRMMDRSVAGNRARNRALEATLASVKTVDPMALSPDRQRTYAIVTTIFDGMLAPSRVVDYGTTDGAWTQWFLPYPIVQNSGPTVDIPNFLNSQQPVTNEAEADAFLLRLASVEEALDGALESYRQGVAQGAIPPDFIVDRSLEVVEAFLEPAADQNPLYLSFTGKLELAGIANAQAYADQALEIIDMSVLPAYGRIADYLGEIRSSAPHDAGVWRLPNGDALYAAMIRQMTDSTMSPDEIHRIGLDEVNRITHEMDEILRANGYTDGTVGERMQLLNVEPRFLYDNDDAGKEALLADVRAWVEEMYAELPNWFVDIPEHKVEVRPVPGFSEAAAPIGYYNAPAPDGSRPGYYFINLRDTSLHPRWTLPSLSYHEAVPGHHLDGATLVDLDVPILVKALWSNTSGEGWALYAEQLAAEMGMYADDPYGDLGRLQAELHRAVRLVADTGMHAKKWSREEAIDYMVGVEGLDVATATSEIERFVVWPAQALGYKLGQLKINALRDAAQEALGDRFEMREFNQTVLNVASTPLPYIEASVIAWTASFPE